MIEPLDLSRDAGLNPDPAAAVRLDRACTELRRGRVLALSRGDSAESGAAGRWLLAAAVETLSEAVLRRWCVVGSRPQLLLSAQRLQALGWPASTAPSALALPPNASLRQVQKLAAVVPGGVDLDQVGAAAPSLLDASGLQAAALLGLCKRARLMPALWLLALDARAAAALAAEQVLTLDAADLSRAAAHPTPVLQRVSDARVPLLAAQDCTLVVFRELEAEAEHLAIVVGEPPQSEPVPVRLHSACLTGDLFGSLRCDCGPQLQRAVATLAETGGVLLYLAQEGRGIGLVNKLRAYRLQDAGLDTLQADRHLGFREDERDFGIAAALLHALGYPRIRLLTNNPHKIAALRDAGIDVVERLPLHAPTNAHNARYIATKRRAGHLGAD